jgi:uncharacterized protein YfdQ (DUF2303 family)
MDSSAINAIRDLATAELNSRLLEKDLGVGSLVAIPKDYTVVNLQQYKDAPKQFEGMFSTHVLDEFVAYLQENGNDDTGLFIDPDNSEALAIIDMGKADKPKWGRHRAVLKLKKTAEYDAVTAKALKVFGQTALIDFVEDFAPNIIFYTGDQKTPVDLSSAILAIRKMTVEQKASKDSTVGDFKAATNKFDEIEVRSKGAELPSGFFFTCPPHEGFSEKLLDCRLRATGNGDKVELVYRILGYELMVDSIAGEFKELLAKESAVPMYCGKMKY